MSLLHKIKGKYKSEYFSYYKKKFKLNGVSAIL